MNNFRYGSRPTISVHLSYALERSEQITAIIAENGNPYEDGLGKESWTPLREYRSSGAEEDREVLRSTALTFEATRWQYEHGSKNPEQIAPESYTLDAALMMRPGKEDIQLDQCKDCASNVALYPQFQADLRSRQVPLLALWGKNDASFPPVGAKAYKRDLPGAKIQLLDAGHSAVETNVEDIAASMKDFLKRKGIRILGRPCSFLLRTLVSAGFGQSIDHRRN